MSKVNNIIFLMISFFFFSCEDDRGNVNLAISDILLSYPEDDVVIDLNGGETAYRFSWDRINEEGSTIIFSTNKYLTQPQYVDAGVGNFFVLSLEEMEDLLVNFNIQDGKETVIYWSVKPTKRLGMVSGDIHSFRVISKKKKLISPEDKSNCDLDGFNPHSIVEFAWDQSITAGNRGFILYFANTSDFSDKKYALEVGAGHSVLLSHAEIQNISEKLGFKKYSSGILYWNVVNTSDDKWISRDVFSLKVRGFMVYTDTRGEESITYKVTRINYSDGTSLVWLAENLRTVYYPDGTPIEEGKVLFASSSNAFPFGNDYVTAYGGYYTSDIKLKIAPIGFHLPTRAEYEKLFGEAEKVSARWNVLKDPAYYGNYEGKENGHLNEWGLGLVSAGMWQGGILQNYNSHWCYLHAADYKEDPRECILHDGGNTLWTPWPDAVPARFILDE